MKKYEKNIKTKNIFLGFFSLLIIFTVSVSEVYAKKKNWGLLNKSGVMYFSR